jgi:hypothetical protein
MDRNGGLYGRHPSETQHGLKNEVTAGKPEWLCEEIGQRKRRAGPAEDQNVRREDYLP